MRISLVILAVASSACFDMPPPPHATNGSDAAVGGGDAGPHDADPFRNDAAFGHVNIVFVSKATVEAGVLGSAAAGDTTCANYAVAAGFPGKYVAWLADSTRNAATALGSARGWVRPDGLPVADTVADLAAGKIFYPIAIDEAGSDHTGDQNTLVATGANPTGSATANTCANYTSPIGQITCGLPQGTTTTWTNTLVTNCADPTRLYCFEVDLDQEVDPPPAPPDARIAFVSKNAFSVTGGLPAADLQCQTEATAASLPGTYVALLATSTASAASRVTPAIYKRPDGVTIGPLTNAIITPINVTAADAYVDVDVWTGAASIPAPFTSAGSASTTCGDWTNSTVNGTSASTVAGPSYFNGQLTVTCTSTDNHLYCAQQ